MPFRPYSLAALSLIVLCGCSGYSSLPTSLVRGTQVSPASDAPLTARSSSPGFYPLDVGNRWSYVQLDTYSVDFYDGSTLPPFSLQQFRDVLLTGTQSFGGRDYVVQHEVYRDGTGSSSFDFLYRQDRTGLYVADTPGASSARVRATMAIPTESRLAGISDPSRRSSCVRAFRELAQRLAGAIRQAPDAAPGSGVTEAQLLAYPLHTGATWNVRTDVRFVNTVESPDRIQLPAGAFKAWRVHEDSDLFGVPPDQITLWYGADGYLQLRARLNGVFTDPDGNPIGIAHVVEELSLTSLDLQGASAIR